MENLGDWYTLEAGAEYLGTTRAAVYEGLRRYGLETLRLGGKVLLFRPKEYAKADRQAKKGLRK